MSKDYERLCETSESMIYAVMTRLMVRRLACTLPFQTVSGILSTTKRPVGGLDSDFDRTDFKVEWVRIELIPV
jgi:hypothetical protein